MTGTTKPRGKGRPFTRGTDPRRNTTGKNKIPLEIKEAFKTLTPHAINYLVDVMEGRTNATAKDIIKVCEIVLDRAYGRPRQELEIDTESYPPVVFVGTVKD